MKSKYNSLAEWSKYDRSGYQSAKYNGLIPKICEIFGWEPLKIAKPKGYWTPETIFEESKKYKDPKEWKKNSSTSYTLAFKFDGLYEKCLIEMGFKSPKKIGFWKIKENVLADAKKYKTRSEWGTGPNSNLSAYQSAKDNGWFEEATAHMEYAEGHTPAGFWTKEKVLADAKKYKTRTKFRDESAGAYQSAKRNGWYEEATAHMEYLTVKNGFWQIKENVLADAKKYKTRSEFSNESAGAYISAKKNGWYEEATAHMEYAEGHTPAGFWTKEKVLNIAKKYNNRLDWVKADEKSVIAARTNGWLDECLEHMELLKKAPNYWNNKERCIEDALNYKTRSEWQKGNSSAYKSAKRNGWLNDCCQHMTYLVRPSGYWTKELCVEEALKYNNEKEWRLGSGASLQAARKNKWLDECTKHMILNTKKNYWTFERCIEDALNYNSRSEWSKNSRGYSAARKNGWLDECCSHMTYLVRPNGTWTKELLIIEARKWDTPKDWRELGEGIARAKPLGCYDECIAHMIQNRKPMGFWHIKENVLVEALKYKTRDEWQKNSNGSKKSAVKNG